MGSKYLPAILVTTSVLLGCAPLGRFQKTESEVARLGIQAASERETIANLLSTIDRLSTELAGVSSTSVEIGPTSQPRVLFGNQSGFNADISITNVSEPSRNQRTFEIRTIQIPRPGADKGLPIDYERTVWLDISAKGARRQIKVPCGFQVEERAGEPSKVSFLIRYEKSACSN